MKKIISKNPGENFDIIGEVAVSTNDEIVEKVNTANQVRHRWKSTDISKRIKTVNLICDELKSKSEEIAHLMTKETGKPITFSNNEIIFTLKDMKWIVNNIENILKEETTYSDSSSTHKIVYEPVGSVIVIAPGNMPFGTSIYGILTNILVGNTVVFKMSEECPLLGKKLEEVISKHLPLGVFSEVYGDSEEGKKLVEQKADLICFTGSTNAGKEIYEKASDKLTKVILEMGGSNPCVVFEDCNIKKAAETIYRCRFQNTGQMCDAVKRLIVHESVFENLLEELKKNILKNKLGYPSEPSTDVGSLASEKQLKVINNQFDDAIMKGAHVIIGGKQPSNLKGAYFEPTILTNISTDMKVWKEEVFGPILPVISFKNLGEALKLANDSDYGLGARIITNKDKTVDYFIKNLDVSNIEINHSNRWIPNNPFGGFKKSGIGVNFGRDGIRSLCRKKVISLNT